MLTSSEGRTAPDFMLPVTFGPSTVAASPSIPAAARPGWSSLGMRARMFRIAHGTFGALNLAGLGYVWLSAIRRRRDRLTYASMALLASEGAALVIGRGDCPLGAFQAGLGDSVPMFEWVLPPRAAKAAIPLLALIAAVGIAAAATAPGNRRAYHRRSGRQCCR